MNLRQLSAGDPVTAIGLQGLFERCPILEDAQFYQVGGDLDRLEKTVAAGGSDTITRALNTENTPISKTPAYANITKYIVSRTIKIDNIVAQRGRDMTQELADKSLTEMRLVGSRLQRMFVKGDSGSVTTDFDGFENIVDASCVLSGDQLGKLVPVGGDAVAGGQQEAVERLLSNAAYCKAFYQGKVWAYMNSLLAIRITSVAKKLGYYSQIQVMGQLVDAIGDIIIRPLGMDEDGTHFLPFTETPNGGNSSSIWFVGWGEKSGVTCPTSAGLVGEYKAGDNIFGFNQYDLDMGMGVQDKNALVQSPGWKLTET